MVSLIVNVYLYREVRKTEKECKQEGDRADVTEEKYVQLLKADIEERKGRDKTLELISRAASRNRLDSLDKESS